MKGKFVKNVVLNTYYFQAVYGDGHKSICSIKAESETVARQLIGSKFNDDNDEIHNEKPTEIIMIYCLKGN